MLCQIAVGPEFQNFMSLQYVASFLGPRRASENLDCYPKMSTQSFLFILNCSGFHLKQNMFFSLFKSEN